MTMLRDLVYCAQRGSLDFWGVGNLESLRIRTDIIFRDFLALFVHKQVVIVPVKSPLLAASQRAISLEVVQSSVYFWVVICIV